MKPETGGLGGRSTRLSILRYVAAVGCAGALAWGGVYAWQWRQEAPARKLYERGEELYRSGQLEPALEAWQTATETRPRWTPPYFRMAEVLQAHGMQAVAVQVLLRAGDASPRTPHLTCRLAHAYALADSPVQAQEASKKAVDQEPRCSRAHLAFALAYRDDSKAALEHLRAAHRLNPKDTEVLVRLARALAHGGKPDEAKEPLQRLMALVEPNVETHYLHGVVLSARPGDQKAVAQAEQHLLEALRLQPSRADAHAQLGILYSRQRQWRRARLSLEKARELNPYNPAVLYQLAQVYRQLRDKRANATWDALRKLEADTKLWKELQRQLKLRPDDMVLMLDAAEVSLRVGATSAASGLANAVLRRQPESGRARRVLEQLRGPLGSAPPADE